MCSPTDKLYDYDTLLAAELNRMKLKNRVRKREEGLTDLTEDVEKLILLAYADPAMMEVQGIDHFIDALHEETESSQNFARGSPGVGIFLSRQRTIPVRGAKIDCSSEPEETTIAAEFQKQVLYWHSVFEVETGNTRSYRSTSEEPADLLGL